MAYNVFENFTKYWYFLRKKKKAMKQNVRNVVLSFMILNDYKDT